MIKLLNLISVCRWVGGGNQGRVEWSGLQNPAELAPEIIKVNESRDFFDIAVLIYLLIYSMYMPSLPTKAREQNRAYNKRTESLVKQESNKRTKHLNRVLHYPDKTQTLPQTISQPGFVCSMLAQIGRSLSATERYPDLGYDVLQQLLQVPSKISLCCSSS